MKWKIQGDAEPYHAIVRLTLDGPGGALRPTALYPVILEWPRKNPDREPGALTVSVPKRCGPNPGEVVPVRLDWPVIDESSCVGESLYTQGDPRWCRPIPRASEVYGIRERGVQNLGELSHRVHVVFEGSRARVTLDERTVELPDANTLRAMFNEIWDAPSEREEGCRDGVVRVVEGRRPERWKVVRRRCSSVVDFDQVSKAVADIAGPSP